MHTDLATGRYIWHFGDNRVLHLLRAVKDASIDLRICTLCAKERGQPQEQGDAVGTQERETRFSEEGDSSSMMLMPMQLQRRGEQAGTSQPSRVSYGSKYSR